MNDDVCILIKISLEFVPMCSIGSIGSGNGLVPSGDKPLPITWANVEPDLWCHIISSLGHNELSMSCSPRIHFTNDFFIVIQFKNSNSVVSPILLSFKFLLTQWGRVAHICISKLTIIGSDNGLSPGRRQAIIWTNAGILLIRHSGTNVSEILSKIHIFIQENELKNVIYKYDKMVAILSCPQCIKLLYKILHNDVTTAMLSWRHEPGTKIYCKWMSRTRTEINFNTKERFFAPTFEIMEQKWSSQELFLKPQTRYLVGLGSKTLLLDSIT